MLYVIITIFGPLSGAHFNPAVNLVMMLRGDLDRTTALAYIIAQIIGGCVGTLAVHFMFDIAPLQISATARAGLSQWFAEFVATFALLATILGCLRRLAQLEGICFYDGERRITFNRGAAPSRR